MAPTGLDYKGHQGKKAEAGVHGRAVYPKGIRDIAQICHTDSGYHVLQWAGILRDIIEEHKAVHGGIPANRKAPRLKESLKKIVNTYWRAGFMICSYLMDQEFEKLKGGG